MCCIKVNFVLCCLSLSCVTHLVWLYSYIWWKYKDFSIVACYRGVVALTTICTEVVLHFAVSAKIAAFCIVLMVIKIPRMTFYVNVLEGYLMEIFFILFWVLKWFQLVENSFKVYYYTSLVSSCTLRLLHKPSATLAITVWPSGDSLRQSMQQLASFFFF